VEGQEMGEGTIFLAPALQKWLHSFWSCNLTNWGRFIYFNLWFWSLYLYSELAFNTGNYSL